MRRTGLAGSVLVSLGTMVLTSAGCPSDTKSLEELEYGWCVDSEEAICKKVFECEPMAGQFMYGFSDPSGCRGYAEQECKKRYEDDGSGDPCTPPNPGPPTQAELDACLNQINGANCANLEQELEGGPCKTLEDKYGCPEDDDPDAGPSGEDVPGVDIPNPWDLGGFPDLGGGQDPGPNPTDPGGTPTDPGGSNPDIPPVTINYDACIAAMNASCGALVSCADSCCPLLAAVAAGCEPLLTAASATVEATCKTYMDAGVPAEEPLALYLNTADPAAVEQCISDELGDNCNQGFINDVIAAMQAFSGSGDSSDLVVILEAILAGCY